MADITNKTILIDKNRCTGCRLCEMVCSLKKQGECSVGYSCIRIFRFDMGRTDIPVLCIQCKEALCNKVCPCDAIYINSETNVYIIDRDVCIKCYACEEVCPYHGIFIDEEGNFLKCDLCGGDPLCVKYCDTQAIKYVELDNGDVIQNYNIVADDLRQIKI